MRTPSRGKLSGTNTSLRCLDGMVQEAAGTSMASGTRVGAANGAVSAVNTAAGASVLAQFSGEVGEQVASLLVREVVDAVDRPGAPGGFRAHTEPDLEWIMQVGRLLLSCVLVLPRELCLIVNQDVRFQSVHEFAVQVCRIFPQN